MQLRAASIAQGKAGASSSRAPVAKPSLRARVCRRAGAPVRRLVIAAAAEPEAPAPQQRAQAPRRPLAEIQPNEVVEGRVASVQSFGAFVDIGAESQGLIHVSQLTDGFVKNVGDVIKVGEAVKVRVLSVDVAQRRLALTRKGLLPRAPGAAPGGREQRVLEEEVVEEGEAADPNSAELDGLTFMVADEDEDGDLDPADVEVVEDFTPEQLREIAIASEDIVSGTVKAVSKSKVTVAYTLEDGTEVEGDIHVSELLAPAALADAEPEEGVEGDLYVEVPGIDPAQYYKVGDAIQAFLLDIDEDGDVQLTQRLPEEADDELAALAAELEGYDPETVPDSLIVQGLWAAAEEPDSDDDEDENGDLLLEQLDPSDAAIAAAAAEEAAVGEEGAFVSAVPEELRLEAFVKRSAAPPNQNKSLVGAAMMGLRLPDREVNADPSAVVTGALFDANQAAQEAADDDEEDELVGVSVADTTYIPASVMRRLGHKIVQAEEGGAWEVVPREGASADQSAAFARQLASLAAGTGVSSRDVDRIVADLMADDEDEAEVPVLARRNPVVAAAAVSAAGISAAEVKALRTKTGAGMMDCKKALAECGGDSDKAIEWLRQKGLSGADKKAGRVAAEGAIVQYIHPGSRLGVLLEVNCETDFVAAGEVFTSLAGELAMVVASSEVVCVSVDDMPPEVLAKEREVEMGKEDLKAKPEAVRAKIVEGRLEKIKKNFALLEQPSLRDNNKSVAETIKEAIAATGENIQVRRFVKFNLGEGLEKRSNDFAAEVAQQTQAKAKEQPAPAAAAAAADAPKEQPKQEKKEEAAKPAVQVSAGLVKQLRDKSGAGMMDCKKALAENNGNVEAASEWLRKKGLASADKKAGRLAAEGALVSYIHPGSRLGVLLEVNCETDFVAAGEVFNKLANTIAMQIAASPDVEYVAADEIPAEVFAREKEIEMGREDLASKPEAIRAKIAEGRVKKLTQERVLLEQPYLLDQNKTVAEAVKEAIAACGENIQVRRFERFVLGEGIEKKESNLAAEVAAATGGQ